MHRSHLFCQLTRGEDSQLDAISFTPLTQASRLSRGAHSSRHARRPAELRTQPAPQPPYAPAADETDRTDLSRTPRPQLRTQKPDFRVYVPRLSESLRERRKGGYVHAGFSARRENSR